MDLKQLHGGGEESIGDEVEERSLCTAVLVVLPCAVPLQHLKGVDAYSRQLLLQHSQEKVGPSNNYIYIYISSNAVNPVNISPKQPGAVETGEGSPQVGLGVVHL